ncbi:hypothetical protein PInf_026606 [Phytophthora infestans]|nr:hypothetical protein PInf_026606 [Phytophthora infestans]
MKEQVKQLQVEGNALYADGRYDAARINADSWEAVTASQLLSNRAQTAIQERDFAAALHDATQALKYNTKNEKALLRNSWRWRTSRGSKQRCNWWITSWTMERRARLPHSNTGVAARRRLRKNLARDREVAASEVQQMGKMVHDKQQLRINFGCLLPSQVPLDQFFNVNVNIGNEFEKYKLTFQEPLDPSDTGDLGSADATGKLTLNGRGKASFRVAHDILLAESPGNLGIGGKLWDSCLVLTRYLAARREILFGKRVVELGSGLGLVGIFCSLLGARVTLTDLEEVTPLLDYNIHLNYPQEAADSAAKGAVLPVAQAHLWGDPPRDLPLQPDVIVLSDVVYDPEGYAPLVTSLEALATSSETRILMAHRSRPDGTSVL